MITNRETVKKQLRVKIISILSIFLCMSLFWPLSASYSNNAHNKEVQVFKAQLSQKMASTQEESLPAILTVLLKYVFCCCIQSNEDFRYKQMTLDKKYLPLSITLSELSAIMNECLEEKTFIQIPCKKKFIILQRKEIFEIDENCKEQIDLNTTVKTFIKSKRSMRTATIGQSNSITIFYPLQ